MASMNLWGATPFLAVALMGGSSTAHAAAVDHTIQRSSAAHSVDGEAKPTPAPAATPVSLSNVSLAPTSPVLNQVGPDVWETKLLLNDSSPGCQENTAAYLLQTLSPDGVFSAQISKSFSPLMSQEIGSSCEVTLSFIGLRQVPGEAVLVIDQAGSSSAVVLPVIRDVTLFYYLGVPLVGGSVMVLGLLVLSMLRIRINGRRPRIGKEFWTASGASTLNNNWAANIGVVFAMVGTFFGLTTAVSSLFPGVEVDRFAIVVVTAGVIVIAAPLVFRILYLRWTARNPGVNADSILTLSDGSGAAIVVATGASIIMSGEAAVGAAGVAEQQPIIVRAGYVIQVPPGSEICVLAGGVIAMPGTADIGIQPGSPFEIRVKAAAFTISATDMIPIPASQSPDTRMTYPVRITANGGAKITVAGFADVTLPPGTEISGRRSSQPIKLLRKWDLRIPANNTAIAASLELVMIQAIVTTFGTGTLIGTACVLTYGLSAASQPWRDAMLAIFLIVALVVLYSIVNSIRAQFASPS
jgi:hypothetical protein